VTIFHERLQQSLAQPNLREKLLAKAELDEDGYLLWKGTIGTKGYGKYNSIEVHKLWYVLHHGPVPEGLVLAHACHKKLCLTCARPATQGANIREMAERITHCPYGHPYDKANTFLNSRGGRHCRTCNNAQWKKGKEWQRAR